MKILRISAKLYIWNIFNTSSCFSIFKLKQGNPKNPFLNWFIVLTSSFHASNQPTPKLNNLDEAISSFHHMLQTKPIPPISKFNELLNVIAKMGYHSQAILMFKKLSVSGATLNEYTMSTVINCYCHLKEVELGFAMLASFFKSGYSPNIVCYNCLTKGLFLKDQVGEAVGLFKKLVRENLCELNEFSVSIVLDGLCKSGYLVNAVELLQLAERKNWKLNPGAYTTVIDALCKARMLKDGMELLYRMIDRDIIPDVVTYTCFIHGLCNNGKLDLARTMYNDLASKKIYPDVIAYTVMIQGLCGKRLFNEAKGMLEEMERVGCLPDSVTYNIVVQACLHHRGSFYTIDLLKQVVGRDFQLDACTLFMLLRQIQVLRQMSGIYDVDVINHLIRKLISCDARHDLRDRDDHVVIQSLIQKLS